MAQNNKNNWLYFSQSYLQIAKLACQELIHPKHNKRSDVKSFWQYHTEELIIPIFYNIKHGIEIFIKTLILIIDNKNNPDKPDAIHDIYKLFNGLKQKFKKLKLKPCVLEKDQITQKMIDNFPEDIDKIEKLIQEFYKVELLKSKIGNDFTIYDIQNDIFRYPNNKALIEVNWEETLPRFKKEEIEELKNNIKKLYNLFNSAGYIITILLKRQRI